MKKSLDPSLLPADVVIMPLARISPSDIAGLPVPTGSQDASITESLTGVAVIEPQRIPVTEETQSEEARSEFLHAMIEESRRRARAETAALFARGYIQAGDIDGALRIAETGDPFANQRNNG